jgi:hypothetical protein
VPAADVEELCPKIHWLKAISVVEWSGVNHDAKKQKALACALNSLTGIADYLEIDTATAWHCPPAQRRHPLNRICPQSKRYASAICATALAFCVIADAKIAPGVGRWLRSLTAGTKNIPVHEFRKRIALLREQRQAKNQKETSKNLRQKRFQKTRPPSSEGGTQQLQEKNK